jgi:hypothetical protein
VQLPPELLAPAYPPPNHAPAPTNVERAVAVAVKRARPRNRIKSTKVYQRSEMKAHRP